jgi:hypothetical protein
MLILETLFTVLKDDYNPLPPTVNKKQATGCGLQASAFSSAFGGLNALPNIVFHFS